MNCCICGKKLIDYGNNPYPLCSKDDYESRCCNDCNNHVTTARIYSMKSKETNINVGDLLIVFWSKNSQLPTETIRENGKFFAGYISEIKENTYIVEEFPFEVDKKTDSYIILDK